MNRHMSTFPINNFGLKKLLQNGFIYEDDIYINKEISPKVAQILSRTNNSVKSVSNENIECRSALDFWEDEESRPRIVTLSRQLDHLLDGGFSIGEIVELFGPPGSGKTQICIQLCVSVQIPKSLGGLEGEAIYIESDHGFSVHRLEAMAKSCIEQLSDKISDSDRTTWNNKSLLSGVRVAQVSSIAELFACLFRLNDILKTESKVRLIILDSLAFLFRDGEKRTSDRTSQLFRLLQELHQLACSHSLVVVLTNQVTTRFDEKGSASIVPALGDTFPHRINTRLLLGTGGRFSSSTHVALLVKSASHPESSAFFRITEDGIRDCE